MRILPAISPLLLTASFALLTAELTSAGVPSAPAVPTPVSAWLHAAAQQVKSSGIVKLAPVIVVTTTADELDAVGVPGQGISLREALRDVDADGTITFDASVFTSASPASNTISLTQGELTMNKSFTVDASGLTEPVIIQANGASRHFSIYPGKTVALKHLTLLGGNGVSTAISGQGGSLYNSGSLSLTDCRISGNTTSFYGGGIFSYAVSGNTSVTLLRCAIEGNSAGNNGAGLMNWAIGGNQATMLLEQSTVSGNLTTKANVSTGGGFMNYSTNGPASLTLRRCTVQGNVATSGAGLMNYSNNANAACSITLEHVTITENTPLNGAGAAAGIRNFVLTGSAIASLTNTILAGNVADSWDDLYADSGGVTSLGGNLIGVNHAVVPLASDHFGNADVPVVPGLAPLDNYGGPTKTMALLPGSLARNAGVVLPAASQFDQRGFPVQALPDSGAYETGNLQNYAGWIWEQLPVGTSAGNHASTLDFDGDGSSNGDEWLAGTLPTNAGSFFSPALSTPAGQLVISFPSVSGRSYRLMTSDDLSAGSWTATGSLLAGTGSTMSFSVNPAAASRKLFRVQIQN